MSIGPIDNWPTDEDTVSIVDPGDTTVEPSHGRDTEPYDLRTTNLHDDPQGEAFTHLGVSEGREIDALDWLNYHTKHDSLMTDPDAMFTTGTPERGERYIHDEALQVRQLVPTEFANYSYAITSSQGTPVAFRRPERMTIILSNTGANTVFIGRRRNTATPTAGFPILPGSVLHLDAVSAIIASVVDGSSSTLSVLEQFRTDNGAE